MMWFKFLMFVFCLISGLLTARMGDDNAVAALLIFSAGMWLEDWGQSRGWKKW